MRQRKTLNKPLLRKLALKLRRLRHEEHYDQSTFGVRTNCGTAACIAGHAVQLDGWKLVFHADNLNFADNCVRGDEEMEIEDAAQAALGLSREGAIRLFGFDWVDKAPADWPEEYLARWMSRKERKSRIAADLLDAIADGTVKL